MKRSGALLRMLSSGMPDPTQTQVMLPIRKAIMRRRFACFALSPKAETRARNLTLA
jgi:hypothetical protein